MTFETYAESRHVAASIFRDAVPDWDFAFIRRAGGVKSFAVPKVLT